jgi:hypothetical protein
MPELSTTAIAMTMKGTILIAIDTTTLEKPDIAKILRSLAGEYELTGGPQDERIFRIYGGHGECVGTHSFTITEGLNDPKGQKKPKTYKPNPNSDSSH